MGFMNGAIYFPAGTNLVGKFTQSVRRIVQDVKDEGTASEYSDVNFLEGFIMFFECYLTLEHFRLHNLIKIRLKKLLLG